MYSIHIQTSCTIIIFVLIAITVDFIWQHIHSVDENDLVEGFIALLLVIIMMKMIMIIS